ncbi:hypothetical protein DL765_011328 [Monosporascus sp. GIB2]|nr:hypothetical protein DL765_011328 [Monosporascus sp. GIB2]
MERDRTVYEQETTALLEDEPSDGNSRAHNATPTSQEFVPEYALPVALLAALAMASTSATAYFAYATLLCRDPRHCESGETSRYAGFVAAATCIANILGISALGYLQRLAATSRKLGLLLWMLCRSMSAVMLLLGVSVNSIYIALSGRIFEGFASDNLLHFILNAVYSQSRHKEKASSLISYSLAFYMIGVSTSPFVVGLFQNFTVSFFIALALFAVSVSYIQLCMTRRGPRIKLRAVAAGGGEERHGADAPADGDSLGLFRRWFNVILSPLRPFRRQPTHLSIGLSLLTYNVIQSYVFNALLVHTSLRFGFTGKENGFIISIAHSVAALYIFASLYMVPRALQLFRKVAFFQMLRTRLRRRNRDLFLALFSLAIQSLSLTALGFADQAWQVYTITILLAVGLPTPSFIKGYFVNLHEGKERPEALAALAMMETLGSVLGPLLLGGFQTYFTEGGGVFFAAAGLGAVSLVLLTFGSLK